MYYLNLPTTPTLTDKVCMDTKYSTNKLSKDKKITLQNLGAKS